jgi:hypothetical protein
MTKNVTIIASAVSKLKAASSGNDESAAPSINDSMEHPELQAKQIKNPEIHDSQEVQRSEKSKKSKTYQRQ